MRLPLADVAVAAPLGSSSSTMRLASSMSSSLPVSFHQPLTMCGWTVEPAVDQVLDGVGDLQLAARRRPDAATASKIVASNM